MQSVSNVLNHLAFVSFIEIIIIENQESHRYHYGTVMLYIEFNDPVACDLSERLAQTISSVVPVIFADCDKHHQTIRRSYDEQELNVIVLNNRSSITKINKISKNLFPNDDKIIILVNDVDASLPYSNDFVQTVNFLHRFVLIGRNSVMVAFRLYRKTIDIRAYTVQMFNANSVVNHFRKVYRQRLLSLSGKEIRVFVHYAPPWSFVCPIDNTQKSVVLLGPDALVTEFILFHLNATVVMTTDVITEEPDYKISFKTDLRVQLLHKDIFSDTPITDINARYVCKSYIYIFKKNLFVAVLKRPILICHQHLLKLVV